MTILTIAARRALTLGALAIALFAANTALAHTGVTATHGFGAGFIHPLLGVDHLLAMVAIGLWAAQSAGRSRRALWTIPAAFVAAMAGGAALALAGIGLPLVEFGIAGSVVLLGALVATRFNPPVALGAALAALFAVFHGHAHGAEIAAGADVATYAAGFLVATIALHGVGIALGLAARKMAGGGLARASGGAIAAAGAVLVAGVVI